MEFIILIIVGAVLFFAIDQFRIRNDADRIKQVVEDLKNDPAVALYAEFHPDILDLKVDTLSRDIERARNKARDFVARSSYSIPLTHLDQFLVDRAECHPSSKFLEFDEVGISGITAGTYIRQGNIIAQVHKGKLFINPTFANQFAS
ncbi:hypothetical protein [Ferrimonas kyonanensis]|uniref:hypothetical protein n=1 Tax=Ferrimonas kyonanensis TaxID=364763 RepID=UPI0004819AAD|nr:hypothetical protein [Ferrimonas kyonanensis]